MLPVDIDGGSTVEITAPAQTRFENGALAPCSFNGVYEVSQSCQVQNPQQINFVLADDGYMVMNYQNVMTFSGVFFGPLSTKQTEAFTLKITNKAG